LANALCLVPLQTIYKNMEENKDLNEQMADNNAADSQMDINADENAAGTTHLNDAVAEESEMEKLQSELDEQKDKYLRLVAEFDNFRKRNAKERLELFATANKETIITMLEVMDDCDRAEQQLQKSDDIVVIKEGIQLVFQKLRNTLQNKGVKELESNGAAFDVEQHEAITEIPAPTPELVGKVVDTIQKGYYLNEKLVRFAKVVVGK
jgi:molecular chaperone GrpE